MHVYKTTEHLQLTKYYLSENEFPEQIIICPCDSHRAALR